MDPIQVTTTPDVILKHVANKIYQAMEMEPGDLAVAAPDSEQLAAIAIDALSDFGLLDGSYFAVVKHAREILPE